MDKEARVLVVATGPWQFIMAYASISKRRRQFIFDTVLLAPRVSCEMRDFAAEISFSLFDCRPQFRHNDFDGDNFRLNYEAIRAETFNDIKDVYSEVWISSVLNWREVLLALKLSKADVFLYEDGLQSLLKFSSPKQSSRFSLSILNFRNRLNNLYLKVVRLNGFRRPFNLVQMNCDRNEVRKRVKAIYAFDSNLDCSSDRVVHKDDLKAAILKSNTYFSEKKLLSKELLFFGKKSAVIVIGQCFARFGMMSEDLECTLYARIIRDLSGADYEVLWKEHPRTGGRYYDLICGKLDFPPKKMSNSGVVPIEMLLLDSSDKVIVVGVISSSLNYLKSVLDIECFTAADQFLPFLDDVHSKMALHILKCFPSVNLLLEGNETVK